jgi:hypothetical protein
MASFQTPPPPKPTLVPPEVMAEIAKCRNLDEIQALLLKYAKEQIGDDSRFAYPLRIGAAYRAATTGRMFPTGTDQAARDEAKRKNAALEKAVGYSLVHMRSCARLYDDNHLIDTAMKVYQANADKLTNRPRKAEGIDYALGCIRFYKRLIENRKTMTEENALADANDKALPKDRLERQSPKLSARQIIQRKDSVIISLLTMLNLGVSSVMTDGEITKMTEMLAKWPAPGKLYEVIDNLDYSDEEQQLYSTLTSFAYSDATTLNDPSWRLLRLLNDASGIADEDEEGSGDDGPDKGGDGGGGETPIPTPTPAPTPVTEKVLVVLENNFVFPNEVTGSNRTENAAKNAAYKAATEIGYQGIRDDVLAVALERPIELVNREWEWAIKDPRTFTGRIVQGENEPDADETNGDKTTM